MFRKSCLSFLFLLPVIIVSAQNTMKIQSGAVLKTTGGIVITLQDMNLENDGTINQAPGEGTFRFTGSADNTISGTSAPLFDVVEIAKSGSAKLSLLRAIGVGSGINFTSGLIDLNNNNINLEPLALLNGESETSRIIGPAGGYVEIVNTLTAPSSVNPGNLGAVFTSGANFGSTVIRRGHVSQQNVNGSAYSILRYYDIQPTNNSSLNATLRFRYFDAELNGISEPTLVMWKSTDLSNWTNQGFDSRDGSANYVEKSGIDGFSRWTLSALSNPLPVTFLLFNVKCESATGRVLVNWKTAQEFNASHFEIQRSEPGTNAWVTIGTVQAAGNSNIEQHYSFTDNNPLPGGGIYRVAEFDVDGRTQYTSLIPAECGSADYLAVFPNPVQETLFVKIHAASGSPAIIRVFDSKGALVREQRNSLMAGTNNLNVDMSRLASGTYHLLVEWGNGQTRKSVKIIRR